MTTQPDLPGLPAAALASWLADALQPESADTLPSADTQPPGSADWSAEVISGGLSNITYRIRWGTQRLVLRRPPLGDVLPGAHDMRREYRVMTALGPTPVPVPQTVAYNADPSVLGAPFYLMREVPGIVVRSAADARSLTVDQRRGASEQLVDVLADLHAVDPAGCGLADFGRTQGYAARQVRTWGRQWELARTRDLPDMERLLADLTEALPTGEQDTAIVHGDYRLDNTILTTSGGGDRGGGEARIAAVLDWELATLGVPIADLATLLTYWHDPGDDERASISVAPGLTTEPGFLTTDQLTQRYAAYSGRDLGQLDFYLALAAMKLAAILEGVHARYLGGQSVGDGYNTVGAAVPLLAARGLRLLHR